MRWINAALTVVVDAAMAPLRAVPALVGMAALALVTAVGVLLVAKWTINRRSLEYAKHQMQAAIFEMRLFNDDLGAVLRAAAEVVRRNVTYLRLWLLPVLVLTVPLTPLTAQFEAYYAYSGLTPGTSALLTVNMAQSAPEGSATAPAISLDVPPEIKVETPPLWFPAAHQVIWQFSPSTTGQFDLRVQSGNDVLTKTVDVSTGVARRSPKRVQAGFLNELLYPSEAPLSTSQAIEAIDINYPGNTIDLFGWRVSWLVPYLVLTIVIAFALKRPFGVVF